jgi:hypothetical protein
MGIVARAATPDDPIRSNSERGHAPGTVAASAWHPYFQLETPRGCDGCVQRDRIALAKQFAEHGFDQHVVRAASDILSHDCCCNLYSRLDAQSVQDMGDMIGDSARCHHQLFSDLLVCKSARDQISDFPLPSGKPNLTIPLVRRGAVNWWM